MFKTGRFTFDMPFFQAAMSGYTDRPMRLLAKRFGCPLTFTGVMLDKISLHPKASKKTAFQVGDDEHPVGAQILGCEPESMAASAAAFEGKGYDIIDLNFACPVPKVIGRNRGGDLMQKPQLVIDIYRRVREKVRCPVFMKLRIGFDQSEAAQEDFWRICELVNAEKVDAITIHGRTVCQRYKGKADWEAIARVKKAFPCMVVIGSGDIYDAQTAISRLVDCGVDGVSVARGAIGNPWIFAELAALYKGLPVPEFPGLGQQGLVIKEHLEMVCRLYPHRKATTYFRKFLAGYCKHHPERKKVLLSLMSAKEAGQLAVLIDQWYPL